MRARRSVAIVGTGQVGTMIGAALHRTHRYLIGLYDRDSRVADASLRLPAGHKVLSRPEDVLGADQLVLAIPVDQVVGWLGNFGARIRPGTALLDTGSTKSLVIEAMAEFVPIGVHAIGGHPLVGTEGKGPAAARPELLCDSVFALTPCRPDPRAVLMARALVLACAARPVVLGAEDHDRIVARTSHLPHLLAAALAATTAACDPDPSRIQLLSGPGLASSGRLAGSDPRLVASFADANRENLLHALTAFRAELDELEQALRLGAPMLEQALTTGQEAWRRVTGLARPPLDQLEGRQL
ncbi:MAG: prephenate dehydrogenase [Candidatus Dormibacteria bacterium]